MPNGEGLDRGVNEKNEITVLDIHPVFGGRSGWKSSQADITSRVSGAVPSLLGREGCVTTHTGSVSVADSQSNIVIKDSMEGGGCVNAHTGSVSVADSQSNIVCEAQSVGANISSRCAKQEVYAQHVGF